MGRNRVRAHRRRQLRHQRKRQAQTSGNGAQHVNTADLTSLLAENLAQLETESLVGGASGGSFPLSDRGRAWDAGAADQRVRAWASSDGSGDKEKINWGKYGQAFFWKDDSPASFEDFKLGFADIVDGSPVAVWRGVTAAAGAVQGARGGVNIPSGDKSAVQGKIAGYYSKAAKAYDDPAIKAPWKGEAAVTPAELSAALARAEVRDLLDPQFTARAAYWAGEPTGELLIDGEPVGITVPLEAPADQEEPHPLLAELVANLATEPEELAPAETCADCGHKAFAHEDGTGACSMANCDCQGFAVEEETAAVEDALVEEPVTADAVVDVRPPLDPGPALPTVETVSPLAWRAVLLPEGRLTSDNRAIAPGATTWRNLPLSLMAMLETGPGGHEGAQLAGRIDDIFRTDPYVKATGVFDSGEYGQEIARLVGDRTLRGNSVDLAIHEYEVVPRSEFFDEDGFLVPDWQDRLAAPAPAETPEEAIDRLLGGDPEDYVYLVTRCEIGMSTVCPFPAFADAEIALAASGTRLSLVVDGMFELLTPEVPSSAAAPTPVENEPVVTASAAGLVPETPPADWFTNPGLEELTAVIVDDEGRVYGHAAPWETCHIGIPGGCTVAPHSKTEYAMFHLGEIVARVSDSEDVRVPVGQITLDTGHADRRLNASEAARHYDHTGTAVADVICGEDQFGIWVAGALRPDVSESKARVLRGAKLSGDWRGIDGNLELVGLLAVNVPGFPVPRKRALVAAAGDHLEVLSLTAAGINPLGPEGLRVDTTVESAESPAELAVLVGEVAVDPDAVAALEELAARATAPVAAPPAPARPEVVAALQALDDAHARATFARILLPSSERAGLDASHARTVGQITEILASAAGTETPAKRAELIEMAFESLAAAAVREQPAPQLSVTVEPSPAPNVTVESPPPAEVNVRVEAAPTPDVNVEVHPSPAPNVEVTVPPPPPAARMRTVPVRDEQGRIVEVRQEPVPERS